MSTCAKEVWGEVIDSTLPSGG